MANAKQSIQNTLKHEGGYVNSPYDRGKETNWGITIATARAYGYKGNMKDLPIATALEIYKNNYWNPLKLDSVKSQVIADKVYDIAVNCGVKRAGTMLQSALNTLNRRGMDYETLIVDGNVGNKTITILNFVTDFKRSGIDYESVLFKTINILQGIHYINLSNDMTTSNHMNVIGWIRNRIS